MACAKPDMRVRSVDEEDEEERSKERTAPPMVTTYLANAIVMDPKKPLHDLMKKQPCVVGSLQMASGFFSVGLGILFAVSQEINASFLSLFRVSQLTGVMFMFAGALSMLLSKHPRLLPMSQRVNCGCISVTLIAICLTILDLTITKTSSETLIWITVLALCVMLLEVFFSALLCVWFSKQKSV